VVLVKSLNASTNTVSLVNLNNPLPKEAATEIKFFYNNLYENIIDLINE